MYRLIVETTREEDLKAQDILDSFNHDYYTDTEYIYVFENTEVKPLKEIYNKLRNLNVEQDYNFSLDLECDEVDDIEVKPSSCFGY